MFPRLTATAILLALSACAQVAITSAPGEVKVSIDGKPYTTLYFGKDAPKPYLHPLRSASGKIVTRRYPMEQVEGESRDHPHHRGLWFGHGDVSGYNFWENEFSYTERSNRGQVRPAAAPKVSSGKDSGTIDAIFDWLDTNGSELLTVRELLTFRRGTNARILDADVTVTAVRTATFGDTKEGTFALRLADSMCEQRGGKMTNAGGASTMKNVWGKKSPWVDYVGKVEGELLGVAIFDHPGNPRHPTTWHARDYGLFAANIFGEHDFYDDKTRNGSMTLQPGQSLRFRYRVLIHSGTTEQAGIAQQYSEYVKGN